MRYCKTCLNPETRPRIVFNKKGECNACIWAKRKKRIDWKQRQQWLRDVCNTFRRNDDYDVIVPCSGGKDGSYVAWKIKHEFDMHPLCVTFAPPIPTKIGRKNLDNFRDSGFDLLEIRPDPQVYRRLCRKMFVEQARCKFPFVIGIATAVTQIALKFDIPFIIYGEEGETEYGGTDKYADTFFLDDEYMQIYHEGQDLRSYLRNGEFTKLSLKWWLLPSREEMKYLKITWWSKWEAWDDALHAMIAEKECDLNKERQNYTFTDYAQLDDLLQDLHMYEAFLKYGAGRVTADCNLAIRNNRMTREEGLAIVKEKEGRFPYLYLEDYLKYFAMSEKEFWSVIDFWANKDILKKEPLGGLNDGWILKEQPH